MRLLPLVRFELRRSPIFIITGLWALAVILICFTQPATRIPLWSVTTKNLLLACYITLPILAGVMAWVAMRESQANVSDLFNTSPTSLGQRALAVWMAFSVAALIGLGVLFTGVWGWAAGQNLWGSPPLFILVDTLLGLLALISVGYAAGRMLPHPLVSPTLVFILFFLLQTLHLLPYFWPEKVPAAIGNLSPFASYFSWDLTPYYTLDRTLLFAHAGWLLSLTLFTMGIIGFQSAKRVQALLGMGGILFVAMLFGGMLLSIDPQQPLLQASEDQMVCTSDSISICLHPAYAHATQEVSSMIRTLLSPVQGADGAPIRALQSPSSQADGTPLPNGAMVLENGTLLFSLVNYGERDINPQAYFVWVVAWATVQAQYEQGAQPMTVAQAITATWLVETSGYSLIQPYAVMDALTFREQYARFSQMEPTTQAAWIRQNLVAIRAGDRVELP